MTKLLLFRTYFPLLGLIYFYCKKLMLLVRRFRGSVKGRVMYTGPLLRLLDVPGRQQLEQRLVKAVERSER